MRYSDKWGLTISEKKTKIMIFNKTGKFERLTLKMDNLTLKSCSEYNYLGTTFQPSNTFRKARIEHVKKARKSMFAFLKHVNIQNGAQPKTIMKLFNSLVTPILLYNSEIWGAYVKPNQLRSATTFLKSLFDDNLPHEDLQIRCGKIALGVHKKSVNMGVRGEFGLFPLCIEIYTRMMKYLFHLGLLLKEGNPLIRDAIAECKNMIVHKQTCWLTFILDLLNMIKIDVKDQTLTTLDQHVVISKLKETLESRFVNDFFTVMKDSNKLQLYSNLKQSFEEEDYLSKVKFYRYRSAITKFRISANPLPIETGRWKSIEKDKRICTICIGNQLGDEKHYIFHCTHIEPVKARMNFGKLASINISRSSLTMIMNNILNCITETTPNEVGKFLNNLITLFHEHSTCVTQNKPLALLNSMYFNRFSSIVSSLFLSLAALCASTLNQSL